MKQVIHLHTIADLSKLFNLGHNQHPLVTVLDFSKVTEQVEQNSKITTDFYSIMFKNYCKNHIKYGRKTIDFQDGNLICIAPNQTIEIDNEIEEREDRNRSQYGQSSHRQHAKERLTCPFHSLHLLPQRQ